MARKQIIPAFIPVVSMSVFDFWLIFDFQTSNIDGELI